MAESITVEVDASGEVKVSAQGVKGGGCKALTSAIEAAIGKTTDDQKTAEFYQSASCAVGNQQGNQAKAGQ